MRKLPDHKLIVKTKPGWSLKELPRIIAKKEKFNNLQIIEKTDNKKLMNNSDVIIMHSTAMGMEALLLGKPIISVFFRDLRDYFPYDKKIVKLANDEKTLAEAIKKYSKETKKDVLKRQKLFYAYHIPLKKLHLYDTPVKTYFDKKYPVEFVYIQELDTIGHIYGTTAPETIECIKKIDKQLENEQFDIILSDNGMMDVTETVSATFPHGSV